LDRAGRAAGATGAAFAGADPIAAVSSIATGDIQRIRDCAAQKGLIDDVDATTATTATAAAAGSVATGSVAAVSACSAFGLKEGGAGVGATLNDTGEQSDRATERAGSPTTTT